MNNKTINGMSYIFYLFGILALALPVHAASFDCAKASTKVEHLICDNPEISKLDEELNTVYIAALQNKTKANMVKQAQKQWLKVRNTCTDAECVMRAYETRVMSLKLVISASEASPNDASNTGRTRDAKSPAGEYVLRASVGGYKEFCTTFTSNLNEFRNLDFNTCDARLSPKYLQFSRPQWEEIPLDMDMVNRILTNRPSIGFKRWLEVYKTALASNKVKLWRIQVDLLNDGNLDTMIRLDHASDGTQPYCSYFDSKQTIANIPEPEASKLYAYDRFNNDDRLGGDMIYDANTKRYYLLNWNRYAGVRGGGLSFSDIGATASVTVSVANSRTFGPVCWIDWVAAGHRNSNKDRVDTHGMLIN